MGGFNEVIHLKGKAEEDLYFARLDRERVAALHAGEESGRCQLAPDVECVTPGGTQPKGRSTSAYPAND